MFFLGLCQCIYIHLFKKKILHSILDYKHQIAYLTIFLLVDIYVASIYSFYK